MDTKKQLHLLKTLNAACDDHITHMPNDEYKKYKKVRMIFIEEMRSEIKAPVSAQVQQCLNISCSDQVGVIKTRTHRKRRT